VKGLLRAEDVEQVLALGADAVVVSNHGGRNLDSARAPIDIVPEVVAAVGDRITVMVDGGIRRGSDITKALALGARAVLIGRATLYGISAAGQAGAERAIDLLHSELDRTMGYLGSPRIENIDPTLLTR
jgi:(S)-mandelate dehydrogenase